MTIMEAIHSLEKILRSDPENMVAKHQLSNLYLEIGNELWKRCHPSFDPEFNLEKPDEPIACWMRAIELNPQCVEAYFNIAVVRNYQGRHEEGTPFIKRGIETRNQLSDSHPLARLGFRFLQTRTGILTQFGHLTSEPEVFIKIGELGWRPSYKGILLASKTANTCLLNYWRRHICVVTDPSLIRRLTPLASELEYETFWTALPNGNVEHLHNATIAVQRHWEAEGRPPLLSLTQEHLERGQRCLEEMGVPRNAWFVSLHVRDNASYKETSNSGSSIRNADSETYLPAIKEIVDRGGWVIRVGDPSMDPLPEMDYVIDYAHSELRSDWMDIFLSSACRFLVGVCSGPVSIPSTFGVPVIITNVSPLDGGGYTKKDLFIPKMYWSEREDRMLSFEEAFAPPLRACYNNYVLKSLGIRPINNSPEEIQDVVCEMLDRLDCTFVSTEECDRLQKRYADLAGKYESYGISYRIGRNFLRKYARLL
ncbi:TIGR04372 family glycosyltransferase [bacterium]|nr:TIGR04372 family glycosyltransferase [bacterium]